MSIRPSLVKCKNHLHMLDKQATQAHIYTHTHTNWILLLHNKIEYDL
jgi:hypothetical protein